MSQKYSRSRGGGVKLQGERNKMLPDAKDYMLPFLRVSFRKYTCTKEQMFLLQRKVEFVKHGGTFFGKRKPVKRISFSYLILKEAIKMNFKSVATELIFVSLSSSKCSL